tara:strand:+ start:1588 stop:3099 length:1512 start_codon:yes stop_codon:yes gene_type:complete
MARVAYGRSQTRVSTSSYPDDDSSPVGTNEWNLDPEASGLLGFTKITATLDSNGQLSTKDDSSAFTNESGASQAKQSTLIEVECNGSSTTDAVVKIDVTDTNENDIVYLFKGTDGDTVTVTSHSGSFSANGQIKSLDGGSITLNDAGKPVSLMRRGNYWFEFGGGGGVADGSIVTAKLADDAVTSAKIGDNAVNGTHIALTGDQTGDIMYYDGTNYVRLPKGSADEVLQISSSNIPEWGTVSATEIAANAVGASELADDAVDTAAIAADAVTGAKIADDAINSEHYTDASIDTAHIADSQVTADKLASNAITTVKITDANVTLAKLAADAVDGTKIADDAINSEHYTDGSVDLAHLSADSVDGTKIADDAINSEHYTDGSIDTAHIADDQVTLAKMAGLARGKIIYGDTSGNPAALTIGGNGLALKSDGTDLVWGTAGGGAENTIDTKIRDKDDTSGVPTYSTRNENSDSTPAQIWVQELDANNQNLYIRVLKNGSYVNVQIA